ncbi:hypothetical protein Dimus_028370 [Dionaea muscipula]
MVHRAVEFSSIKIQSLDSCEGALSSWRRAEAKVKVNGEGGDKSAKRQQSSGGWLSPSTSDDSLVSLGNDHEYWGNEFTLIVSL